MKLSFAANAFVKSKLGPKPRRTFGDKKERRDSNDRKRTCAFRCTRDLSGLISTEKPLPLADPYPGVLLSPSRISNLRKSTERKTSALKSEEAAVHSLEEVDLALGRARLLPAVGQGPEVVDGADDVVAALLLVVVAVSRLVLGRVLALLLGRGVGLLQRGRAAVGARVGDREALGYLGGARGHGGGAGAGGAAVAAAAGAVGDAGAEGRVGRVLARVRDRGRLAAGRGRVEEGVGQVAHAQRHLQRPLRVRLEDAVEEGLQVRLGVLVDAHDEVALGPDARFGDVLVERHFPSLPMHTHYREPLLRLSLSFRPRTFFIFLSLSLSCSVLRLYGEPRGR